MPRLELTLCPQTHHETDKNNLYKQPKAGANTF